MQDDRSKSHLNYACFIMYDTIFINHYFHPAIRNQKIFATDGTLQQTFEWVNQNRKLFRRPVHGPIVCEVATKDNDAADFLEQHVKNAVLKSFVVECKEDYNLLYREVREKRKMRINIQLVEQGKLAPVNRFYSESMMRSLKADHGVHGYLDECFDAPDAVMQALRSTSNVHSVLVGSAKTGESIYKRNLGDLLSKRDDGSLRAYCVFYPYQGRKEKVSFIFLEKVNVARTIL
jgi:structural maintenance of chromosomes protein 5